MPTQRDKATEYATMIHGAVKDLPLEEMRRFLEDCAHHRDEVSDGSMDRHTWKALRVLIIDIDDIRKASKALAK